MGETHWTAATFVYHRRNVSRPPILGHNLCSNQGPSVSVILYGLPGFALRLAYGWQYTKVLWQILKHHGGRTSSPRVMHLPFDLYAKEGEFQEALATQYVTENTMIPVPWILDVIQLASGKGSFLLMTGVKGREYGPMGVMLDDMPESQHVMFMETLHGWFDQLHRLPLPDNHTISGFMETGVMSYHIAHPFHRGPFTSQDEFHAQPFCQPWKPFDDKLHAAVQKWVC